MERAEEHEFPPGIGPHEGRELELLLTGEKPVARFSLDGLSSDYESAFGAAVASGKIVEFDFPDAAPHRHKRYYCVHGEEWRVKLLEHIDRLIRDQSISREFTSEELHRMDGALLGYSRSDIDKFIENIRSHGG